MKITFCGTPKILGQSLLKGLLDLGLPITQVVTASAKPVGRKKILRESPVAQLASELKLALKTFDKVGPQELNFFQEIKPDLIITSAFGVIFSPALLKLPRLGCLNVHYSLLPEFRGTSPLQTALLEGRDETGVTLMLMDKGVDTGPILTQQAFPIKPYDLLEDLERRSVQTALEMLPETIESLNQGEITPQPQNDSQATLTRMIKKVDGQIDWGQPAQVIYNQYQAYHRWPGMFSFWQPQENKPNQKLTLDKLEMLNSFEVEQSSSQPGTVIPYQKQLAITTGDKNLIVPQKIQLAGKKMLSAADFIRGYPGIIRNRLG